MLEAALQHAGRVTKPALRLLCLLALWHSESLRPRLVGLVFAVERHGRVPRERQLKSCNLEGDPSKDDISFR